MSISTGEAFHPTDGLLIKKAGYTSYHLGACCVKHSLTTRMKVLRETGVRKKSFSFCPTCNLSMALIERMIREDITFLNAKIIKEVA